MSKTRARQQSKTPPWKRGVQRILDSEATRERERVVGLIQERLKRRLKLLGNCKHKPWEECSCSEEIKGLEWALSIVEEIK